jgi:phosphoglycolate phosphatase-like HAD superfamily hydrolase
MLGDSETDMLAGRAAGCRSVMMDAFDLDMLM